MARKHGNIDVIPAWSWAAPAAGLALIAAGFAGVAPSSAIWVIVLAAGLLGWCVFASVHHAEVIAMRVGEPFGSIVLAISVTVIEVALIVSIMLSAKDSSDVLARDTVFATVMIVLGGIVGLCLMLGGARHHEQTFKTDAASAALSVLGTLSVLALVLPNYTLAQAGPSFSRSQLIFVGMASAALYFVFLFVQTIRHRDYFLTEMEGPEGADEPESLSSPLEQAVAGAGLPKAFVGVVIAAIVLLPEGISAVHAARLNRLQTSLNLALGSAMATIGLTIPIVAIVALSLGQPLKLGLAASEMVLLLLVLFISTITLAVGRTTILQGAVHLVIFAVFLFLAAVP